MYIAYQYSIFNLVQFKNINFNLKRTLKHNQFFSNYKYFSIELTGALPLLP